MTQKDKELLLKDLCARLPYGVKCCIYNFGENTIRIKEDILWSVQGDNILTLKSCVEKGEAYMYHQIKPYLFPLSSITEEQKEEYEEALVYHDYVPGGWTIAKSFDNEYIIPYWFVDFCNKNHFDYRGLIPKGLALDATELNIY